MPIEIDDCHYGNPSHLLSKAKEKSLPVTCNLNLKEGYQQHKLDHLFQTILMPNFYYGLSVYGASTAALNSIQRFLDRCYKRKYFSKKVDIRELLGIGGHSDF